MISEEQVRVYNKTLEPNLWDENQKLKSEVRLRLLKVAKDFYSSTEFKSELVDILLLGSSVNYTWTPESDIDVHLVMDISKEGLDPAHYRQFLDNIGGNFNKEHEINIDGHKVEVYLQDVTEKNSTPEKVRKHGAMYSLLHDKWLVAPKYEPKTLDKEAIKKAFHEIKNQIEKVIKSGNVEGLKELMKAIRDYRNKGMESEEGEFSVENIVFKALRHTGLLEKLKDGINTMYDRLVSLEEMESYLNKLNDLPDDIIEELISETIDDLNKRDRPYRIIGAVDDKGHIYAEKSYKNDKAESPEGYFYKHRQLWNKQNLWNQKVIDWRYMSEFNEIYYYEYPSELQSIAVKDYIKNNCKLIAEPTVRVSISATKQSFNELNYKYFEKLEEKFTSITSNDFIVTGMISYDLDIVGEAYQKGGEVITHGQLKAWYGNWSDSIDWRYRSTEHKVYYKDREPDTRQKHVIIDFLHDEYNVRQTPHFIPMTPQNKVTSHYFNLQDGINSITSEGLSFTFNDKKPLGSGGYNTPRYTSNDLNNNVFFTENGYWSTFKGYPLFFACYVNKDYNKWDKKGLTFIRNFIRGDLKKMPLHYEKMINKIIDTSIERMGIDLNTADLIISAPSSSDLNDLILKRFAHHVSNKNIIKTRAFVKNSINKVAYTEKVLNLKPKTKKIFYQMIKSILRKQKEGENIEYQVKMAKPSLRSYLTNILSVNRSNDIVNKIKGGKILIIDDTFGSGSTFMDIIREISPYNPENIFFYAFLKDY